MRVIIMVPAGFTSITLSRGWRRKALFDDQHFSLLAVAAVLALLQARAGASHRATLLLLPFRLRSAAIAVSSFCLIFFLFILFYSVWRHFLDIDRTAFFLLFLLIIYEEQFVVHGSFGRTEPSFARILICIFTGQMPNPIFKME